MDNEKIYQGRDATLTATLGAEGGCAYTSYAGTETITAILWAGDQVEPITGVATAAWLSAAAGTIAVTIAGSGTTTLEPGTYDLELEIGGASALRAQLELLPSAGTTAGRTARVTLQHLRKFYRSIDRLLSRPDFADDPTGLEARADAWDWFCDLLHRHYRGSSGLSTDYQFVPEISFAGAYGMTLLYRDGRRSAELQGWLDAGRLDLTTPVLDAMACHALAQILGGMVTGGDDKSGYDKLAARFAAMAEAKASTITAEIDSDGDGTNDTVIRLDVADTLEG